LGFLGTAAQVRLLPLRLDRLVLAGACEHRT
jgi:hypothetical protein